MGSAALGNHGPHGLSEILYAFSSAAGNNGSAFGGLAVNTDFYNYALAICMFAGRFAIIVPVLAIAGSMAVKKVAPPSPGTFPDHRRHLRGAAHRRRAHRRRAHLFPRARARADQRAPAHASGPQLLTASHSP